MLFIWKLNWINSLRLTLKCRDSDSSELGRFWRLFETRAPNAQTSKRLSRLSLEFL